MLADTKLIYVCAACSHRIEAAEQPCQCPNCRAVGKCRDFPTVETATIAKQNDLLRLGLLIATPKGMKARVMLTPGSAMDMEGYLRIGYANGEAILREGLKRLSVFLREEQAVRAA